MNPTLLDQIILINAEFKTEKIMLHGIIGCTQWALKCLLNEEMCWTGAGGPTVHVSQQKCTIAHFACKFEGQSNSVETTAHCLNVASGTFVNKVLLEGSQIIHLCIVCGCFLARGQSCMVEIEIVMGLQSLKYTFGPFTEKKLAGPQFREC